MVSLVVVMLDGEAIETATVAAKAWSLGCRDWACTSPACGRSRSFRYSPGGFHQAAKKCDGQEPALTDLCIKYNEELLAQARITAACNALHPVEARFCRWLLQTRDLAETDTIPLTQEFLSEMLGVRRTSVTEVASKLQAAGLIPIHARDHQDRRPQRTACQGLRKLGKAPAGREIPSTIH